MCNRISKELSHDVYMPSPGILTCPKGDWIWQVLPDCNVKDIHCSVIVFTIAVMIIIGKYNFVGNELFLLLTNIFQISLCIRPGAHNI